VAAGTMANQISEAVFIAGGKQSKGEKAVKDAANLLVNGGVLAVKGEGGFHLAADAGSVPTVARLRRRKQRNEKPLAIMLADCSSVEQYCFVSQQEADLLTGSAAPIVLLRRRSGCNLAPNLAPGLSTLGVLLPYTEIQRCLVAKTELPLVMTSGNLSEEPLCRDNKEALSRLAEVADGFLLHDRDIVRRLDDSVAVMAAGEPRLVRRARGYSSMPILLTQQVPSLLACGALYKNTFCLASGERAFLSQHMGDLDNAVAFCCYRDEIERQQRVLKITPRFALKDLHPGYLSSQFANSLQLPSLAVQHHHAHVGAVMAEYGLEGPLIGVVYDGTGLGTDGTVWGAEVLVVNGKSFWRAGHLKPVALPGGDAAAKELYRATFGFLYPYWDEFPQFKERLDSCVVRFIEQQLKQNVNAPLASSMGRLFDAVAALVNLRQRAGFEGQAAMELEALIIPCSESYPYELKEEAGVLLVDTYETLQHVYRDFCRGVATGVIAARFHNTVIDFTVEIVSKVSCSTGLTRVGLAGGCMQNRYLLEGLQKRLIQAGLTVYIPSAVPCNDGGLALGQAAIAAYHFT